MRSRKQHAALIGKARARSFEALRFSDFWYHYRALPADAQQLADRCFVLMNSNPRHPSIHLKHVGEFWQLASALPLETDVGERTLFCKYVQPLRFAIRSRVLNRASSR
jgi:hypothetical protein